MKNLLKYRAGVVVRRVWALAVDRNFKIDAQILLAMASHALDVVPQNPGPPGYLPGTE
jgi:hypothetical protein